MKTCPKCNRTYEDESLSFCLDDGTPLTTVSEQDQQYDPQATLFMAPSDLQTSQVESRTTSDSPHESQSPQSHSPFSQQPTQYSPGSYSQQSTPQQSSPFTPSTQSQQSSYQTPPPTWQPPVTQQEQPRKRSFLPWVIAGIGLLVVGGLGLVIVVAIVASMSSNENENNANNINNENRIVINTNNSNNKNNSNNTNNTNNTNNSNTSVDASFVTGSHVAANSEKGSPTTTFDPQDKIYLVYTLSSVPRDMTIVAKLVVDSVPGYKKGSSVDAEDKVTSGYSGSRHFYFFPKPAGWPAGSWHVELNEKKSDGTLVKLKHIDITIE